MIDDIKNIETIKRKIWRPLCQEFYDFNNRVATKARGVFIIDQNGNKIVDLNSSWWVNAIGHNNKKIIKAVKKKLGTLDSVVFADFLHEPALLLTQKLYNLINKNIINAENKIDKNCSFEKFFFADNGSTAIEIALKIAHQFHTNTGNKNKNKILSFKGNYHGETFGAMATGAKSNYFNPFTKLFFEVIFLDFPEVNLDKDILILEKEEEKILIKLENILSQEKEHISSIIIEPIIQGANGMKMARVDFFKKVIKICKENKIIVIFDEVMTGFGRTGSMFAFEKMITEDLLVKPDIIALSKVLTNGLFPFGIVACTQKIYEPFYSSDVVKTFLHSHSHTGNPIICTCALETLKNLEEKEIIENIKKIEDFIINFANNLKKIEEKKGDKKIIEKIRFCGTILAFEINKERFKVLKNKTYFARDLKEFLLKQNIYIRPIDNNIFIIPPYIISVNKLKKYLNIIVKSIYSLNL